MHLIDDGFSYFSEVDKDVIDGVDGNGTEGLDGGGCGRGLERVSSCDIFGVSCATADEDRPVDIGWVCTVECRRGVSSFVVDDTASPSIDRPEEVDDDLVLFFIATRDVLLLRDAA